MLRLSKTKEAALPSPIISDTTKDGKRTILLEDDAVLEYYPDFLNETDANTALKELLETVPWGEHKIYRKASQTWVDQPRLTAWIAADKAYEYTYSGLTLSPHPMTPALEDLKKRIDALTPGNIYDGVLLNNYRNGKDSVNWHSDEDPTLVEDSTIASVSLGCVRDFVLRHKDKKVQHLVLQLKHGSLLLMKQNVQKFYLHSVPKKQGLCSIHNQKDNYGSCTCKTAQRLNLTFRHYKRDYNANQQPNNNNNNNDVL